MLFDDNGISIDGPTSLSTSEDQIRRFEAAGWNTAAVDGHDPDAVAAAISRARSDDSKPWLIAFKTTIGFGAPKKQGTAGVHGSPLGSDEIAAARQTLGWRHPPFEVPEPILDAWRSAGRRGAEERASWQERWAKVDPKLRQSLNTRRLRKRGASASDHEAKRKAAAETAKKATRQWSEFTLDHLVPVLRG